MQPRQQFKTKLDWINYIQQTRSLADLRALRIQCYKEIEALRKRPLIVYASNFLIDVQGISTSIDILDVEGFTDLVNSIPQGAKEVDVLVHSGGGYPDATERIVEILRGRFEMVHFLIPHSAYSAATMLALSGDSITMHPSATLGPIDPQINNTPARSIKRGFDNIRKVIEASGPESLPVYIPLIEKHSIEILEQCQDALDLSMSLTSGWLEKYTFKDGKDHSKVIAEIVKYFSNYDEHLTHARPLTYSKISAKNFPINIHLADPNLSSLLWEAYLMIVGFLEGGQFYKLFEDSGSLCWGRQIPGIQLPPPPQQNPPVPAP